MEPMQRAVDHAMPFISRYVLRTAFIGLIVGALLADAHLAFRVVAVAAWWTLVLSVGAFLIRDHLLALGLVREGERGGQARAARRVMTGWGLLAVGVAAYFALDGIGVLDSSLTIGLVILVLMVAGIGWLWTEPARARHRRYLTWPTVDEYLSEFGTGRGIACRKCGGKHIHQFGWYVRDDERRIHKCMDCNSTLYRSQG